MKKQNGEWLQQSNFTQISVKKKREREVNGIIKDDYKIVGNMIVTIK